MTDSQQMFYQFALQRVQPGEEDEIKAIMSESFRRQHEGTFTASYMAGIVPKMMSLLRPECADEFQKAAAHMSLQLKK